jgi:hypothetical protein
VEPPTDGNHFCISQFSWREPSMQADLNAGAKFDMVVCVVAHDVKLT